MVKSGEGNKTRLKKMAGKILKEIFVKFQTLLSQKNSEKIRMNPTIIQRNFGSFFRIHSR